MRSLLLLSALALCACGTSPMDWCRRNQQVVCESVYKCTTEQQRMALADGGVSPWMETYGTDVASCAAKLQGTFCPDDTNDRVCSFHPEKFNSSEANACLDDIQRATCDEQPTAFQSSTHCAKTCGG